MDLIDIVVVDEVIKNFFKFLKTNKAYTDYVSIIKKNFERRGLNLTYREYVCNCIPSLSHQYLSLIVDSSFFSNWDKIDGKYKRWSTLAVKWMRECHEKGYCMCSIRELSRLTKYWDSHKWVVHDSLNDEEKSFLKQMLNY